ncbi:hypothetical protein GCM10027612_01790 [Microbispora bryophytorum subsp. camponoti]
MLIDHKDEAVGAVFFDALQVIRIFFGDIGHAAGSRREVDGGYVLSVIAPNYNIFPAVWPAKRRLWFDIDKSAEP